MELSDRIITFLHNPVSRDIWKRIKLDDPRLTTLKVWHAFGLGYGPIIEESEIGELARDIGNNTNLQELHIEQNFRIGRTGGAKRLQLLCEGIKHNRALTELVIKIRSHDPFVEEMMDTLTPFIENNTNLKCLIVKHGLQRERMRFLGESLLRRATPLDNLGLNDSIEGHYNEDEDNSIEGMMASFMENPALTPKNIDLGGLRIGHNGCNSIARLLHDPRCSLEELSLKSCIHILDSSLSSLAKGLVGNKKLRKLDLKWIHRITIPGLAVFSNTLCNLSSINRTYSSNHTLQFIGYYEMTKLPDDLRQYLDWNSNADKVWVARRKVYTQHFLRNFRMAPFEKMEPDTLVRVMTFIEKASSDIRGVRSMRVKVDKARISVLYELIKSNPTICEKKNPMPTKCGNTKKRRRV